MEYNAYEMERKSLMEEFIRISGINHWIQGIRDKYSLGGDIQRREEPQKKKITGKFRIIHQ